MPAKGTKKSTDKTSAPQVAEQPAVAPQPVAQPAVVDVQPVVAVDTKPAEVAPAPKKTAKKTKKVVAKAKKTIAKSKKTAKGKASKVRKVMKKKVKVSKKKQPVVMMKLSDEKRPRYFKLLFDDKQKGRFSGNKPKQAANKALTSIIKEKEKLGENVINKEIKFSLKECTRWNKKKCRKGDHDKKIEKIYCYVGERKLLDEQVAVDHIQKDADETILNGGKITKQVTLPNNDVKYYMDVKEKSSDGKETDKHIIVKKINVRDNSKKPTGAVKYAVINEIKYKYTNKVQKFKKEQK